MQKEAGEGIQAIRANDAFSSCCSLYYLFIKIRHKNKKTKSEETHFFLKLS